MTDTDPSLDGPPWEEDVVERDENTDDMFGAPVPAPETTPVAAPAQAAPPAEAIRSARFEDGALVVRVDSNGCTQTADFELSVVDGAPADITVRRVREDLCKALVAEGVELRWTYADLGLEPGAPARILNPLK